MGRASRRPRRSAPSNDEDLERTSVCEKAEEEELKGNGDAEGEEGGKRCEAGDAKEGNQGDQSEDAQLADSCGPTEETTKGGDSAPKTEVRAAEASPEERDERGEAGEEAGEDSGVTEREARGEEEDNQDAEELCVEKKQSEGDEKTAEPAACAEGAEAQTPPRGSDGAASLSSGSLRAEDNEAAEGTFCEGEKAAGGEEEDNQGAATAEAAAPAKKKPSRLLPPASPGPSSCLSRPQPDEVAGASAVFSRVSPHTGRRLGAGAAAETAGPPADDEKIRCAVKTFERASLESAVERMQRTVLCLLAEKKETKIEKSRLLQERRDLDAKIVELLKEVRAAEPAAVPSPSASSSFSAFSSSLLSKLSASLSFERDFADRDPETSPRAAALGSDQQLRASDAREDAPAKSSETAAGEPKDCEEAASQSPRAADANETKEGEGVGSAPGAAVPRVGLAHLSEEEGENVVADILESFVTRFGPAAVRGVETAATKMKSGFDVLRTELAAIQERQRALERQRRLEREARLKMLREESLEYAHHQRLLEHLRRHCELEARRGNEKTAAGDQQLKAEGSPGTHAGAAPSPLRSSSPTSEAPGSGEDASSSAAATGDAASANPAEAKDSADSERLPSAGAQSPPGSSSPFALLSSASGSGGGSAHARPSPLLLLSRPVLATPRRGSRLQPLPASASPLASPLSLGCGPPRATASLAPPQGVRGRSATAALGSRRERLEKAVSSLSEKTPVQLDVLKNVATAVGSVKTVARWLFGGEEGAAKPEAAAAAAAAACASPATVACGEALKRKECATLTGTSLREGKEARFACATFNLATPTSDRSPASLPASPSRGGEGAAADEEEGERGEDGGQEEEGNEAALAVRAIEAIIRVDVQDDSEKTIRVASLPLVVLATEQCDTVARAWVHQQWAVLRRYLSGAEGEEGESSRQREKKKKEAAAHTLAVFLSKAEEESDSLPVRIEAHWREVLGASEHREEDASDAFSAEPESIVA
ncbi:hypothetical protein BESB_010380 [Besnoitia besnoiti]|uniref:Glutamic acid-rich protein n=1 Tax=Besnoitia besnoiti TaxID=94643 RepID=A0A2A9MQA7_BESBE|nr:hypothetical protein BESB_010380 [Besnoitia besnoiti]PFH38696.1 hypothetical protein BESB_010380 [Besnoitia besnoiti]